MRGMARSSGSWHEGLAVNQGEIKVFFQQREIAPKLEPGPPPPTHPRAG